MQPSLYLRHFNRFTGSPSAAGIYHHGNSYGALERGYDLSLVKDAHTTGTIALEDGARIDAANIVEELNIAMSWVSYPGRTIGTATSDEVEFAIPDGSR